MNKEYKTLEFEVSESQDQQRADLGLSQLPELASRTQAANLISAGYVQINGAVIRPSTKLCSGDLVCIKIPLQTEPSLKPLDIPLDVIFDDDDLIVLNKPSGLVMHPAAGHSDDTLVNALVHHYKNLSMGFGELRPGIVHRLDRDTSGLLVVAKNNHAHVHLANQFRERTVHRIYWALTHKHFKQLSGSIESYLLRHPQDRKRFASERLNQNLGEPVSPKGKRALTKYKVLDQHGLGISLVQCKLETGRTHQIRVHLSEMGHPVLGDSLYKANGYIASIKNAPLRNAIAGLNRIGLHAAELGFIHPTTNTLLKFKANWPQNLHPILTALDWPVDHPNVL